MNASSKNERLYDMAQLKIRGGYIENADKALLIPEPKLHFYYNQIPEFDDIDSGFFKDRLHGTAHFILTADVDDKAAGSMIAYDRYHDGSFYIWLAGVAPPFRKKGLMNALHEQMVKYAREKEFRALRIKTRNSRRAMQHWLIKKGFMVSAVEEKPDIRDNRIHLIQGLIQTDT
jgi:ribosomal protein S18 acetylase RimI-like enzyme